MGKLWQKDYSLDALIEKFTIGEDWKLDSQLLISDCLSSIAHARMLKKIGLLRGDELLQLEEELRRLVKEVEAGNFQIRFSDEDGHTAIENHLVEKLGETGKKIHTGRSRNDQVIAALRLWGRGAAIHLLEAGAGAAGAFLDLAEKHSTVPMPGRTHMQIAMPSSVGLWAGAFAEELYDDLLHLLQTALHVDQSPLGSAASYGVPLPLDREMVSEELGFFKLQNNVLYVNNSRGKFESLLLDGAEQLMLTLSKAAQDLILFSMPEFGYFSLPRELCSGSSIMPQKKNPDMLELIRGKSATVSAWTQQVKQIIRALPSGYNRDMQETKEPFLRGLSTTHASLRVMQLTVESLEVNTEVLKAAMPREIYATDEALRLVGEGMSFRDAYREVGTHPERVPLLDAEAVLAQRGSSGAPGNLGLDRARKLLEALETEIEDWKSSNDRRMAALAGGPVDTAKLQAD
jgi:argininosuccinate lyase